MYVICFYWQGDRWQQRGFVPERGHVNHLETHLRKAGQVDDHLPSRYVNNLFYGVSRFAEGRPIKFVCFTNERLDLDKGIEVRPINMVTNSGVLPRLYMFSREAGLFGEQVLCLDIDIMITGGLGRILDYRGLFCSRSNYFGKGNDRRPGGDIMSFAAGEETERIFWKPFVQDVKKAEELVKGRERFWIWHCLNGYTSDLFDDWAPGQIRSYKIHHLNAYGAAVPEGTSIISFHGVPRPHQCNRPWAKKYWV